MTVDIFLFSYLFFFFHQAYSILAGCSFHVHVKHPYYLDYANKRMTGLIIEPCSVKTKQKHKKKSLLLI